MPTVPSYPVISWSSRSAVTSPSKRLRQPLPGFNLQTEPWLFTLERTGRVAYAWRVSRHRACEKAIEAAL